MKTEESSVLLNYETQWLKDLLHRMQMIRRFEEKAAQMYGLRKIGGFCHIYIGQEAVCCGSIAALDLSKDYVMTAYRDHGHALACGANPNAVMAELYGKYTGSSKGKGGSMHIFDREKHFLGGHGIVGAHIPLAAGVAFKIKYLNEGGVVLCFFGDGAAHQGTFHETLNMARIWDLPVVFICENNQYGMGTAFTRVSAVDDLSVRAASYDMPGRQVDGMDALEVYENVKEMADLARRESMPSFLEIKTYRYMGHSMSDPATYRTKDEVKQYRSLDPITILQDKMIAEGILTEEEMKEIDNECKKIANDSVKFAEESPKPELKTLYDDVMVE